MRMFIFMLGVVTGILPTYFLVQIAHELNPRNNLTIPNVSDMCKERDEKLLALTSTLSTCTTVLEDTREQLRRGASGN
jgi:hypothetical protein